MSETTATTWIDIHTHINMLEGSPQDVVRRAKDNGVAKMITIGTNPEDHAIVLQLAKDLAPDVYCTLGVHPHDAALFNERVGEFLLQNAVNPRVVAIGEIGLDYYYNNAPREVQLAAFRAQMTIAEKTGLPVEIHTRDAEDYTIQVISEYSGRVRGVFHCFTGSQRLCDEALKYGYNISISGVVTFKNADELRRTVASVPLERLHVETDAPFLTPVPFRGKKNEPAFVIHTAKCVAELKGVSLETLSRATNANALNMFPKLSD